MTYISDRGACLAPQRADFIGTVYRLRFGDRCRCLLYSVETQRRIEECKVQSGVSPANTANPAIPVLRGTSPAI